MADFSPGQERVLKQMVATLRCEVCRRGFEREQVRITARHENVWILSVRCRSCRKQQSFWIAMKDVEEAVRKANAVPDEDGPRAPVASDEVLDMHQFLETFDGNFQRLFGEGPALK
jgi:hypothetical protein